MYPLMFALALGWAWLIRAVFIETMKTAIRIKGIFKATLISIPPLRDNILEFMVCLIDIPNEYR